MRRLMSIALLLAPLAAFAQSADLPEAQDAPPNVQYQKETHIDFEGAGVTASIVGPSQVFSIERKPSVFNPLIQVRRTFNDQMEMVNAEVR